MTPAELRRLLELAAKAAALPLEWRTGRDGTDVPRSWVLGKEWLPADDDGDSRRLEVKLNLIVGVYGSYTSVAETYDKPNLYTNAAEFVCWHHETAGCAMAATRLAVLRAAAAIGEAMP